MIDLKVTTDIVRKIARDAGEKILEYYDPDSGTASSKKEDGSPVTKADIAANALIVSELQKHFPDHHVLSEECADDISRLDKEYVWIVDPLDGTKEFISGAGEFTVNIALVKDNHPVLGVVFVPATDNMYYAYKAGGAYHESKDKSSRIQTSKRDKIDKMILVKSRSHASEKLLKMIEKANFADVKTSGSSVKGCMIASAAADVYYRFGNTMEWDICAVHIVVEESGGKVTDTQGNDINYNQKDLLMHGFVMSNDTIHDELIKLGENDD